MVRPNCVVPESAGPPPDPEMRRPAPGATERRPNHKRDHSKSQRNPTSHQLDAQDFDHKFAVYDGTVWIGDIKQYGRRFDAFSKTPSYRLLGSFGSQQEAFDAVSVTYDDAS